ncbi:MAG: deoxynucleoside kinase [Saprospirales bacterium]|nr:MAG: deoxynucleoside kinase [Saprospirales bacterium]
MSRKKIKHVAIAGNIGSGKTTLSSRLGRHYNWEVNYEDTQENPYLSDFYDDMKRWSFHLQVYFLNSRYRQIIEIQRGDRTIIQDRTIYEDACIFAPNLYEMGFMSERDFNNYKTLFDTMLDQVAPPDLLIYLRADVPKLVSNIQNRGRDYEGNMSLDYLKRLNEKYERWIDDYDRGNLLIIRVDELDFAKNQEDFGRIVNLIDGEISGLF